MAISVTDDAGRELLLDGAARRVVSLVPSITELLFSMGGGDSMVGITRYCTQPAGRVDAVANVGGTKNPDLEGIRRLAPEIVIVNAEENRRVDFEALCAAGLPVFVSFTHRVAEVPGLMRRLGRLVGVEVMAEELACELEETLAQQQLGKVARRVFCPIWKNPWMSFNGETYAADVLRLAGGVSVCATRAERYPQVELAAIALAQPEVVLLPDEPYVFGPRDLPELEPLAQTPAFLAQRVHFVDGKALSWYGPRTAAALRYFKSLLD